MPLSKGEYARRQRRREYFDIKEEFVPHSPEYMLYVSIYHVKKDLRSRFPDKNPYLVRNKDGDYVLLTALSNLAFLMALQDIDNPFSELVDGVERELAPKPKQPQQDPQRKIVASEIIDPEIEKRIAEIVQNTMRKTMNYRRDNEE